MDDTNYTPMTKKRRVLNGNVKQDSTTVINQDKSKNKAAHKQIPKFRLKKAGELASLCTSVKDRVPVMLTDIQHLLLHPLLGSLNLTESPRWYTIDKCGKITQICCLILEGLSLSHWEKFSNIFTSCTGLFSDSVEIVTPSIYGGTLVQELALVPLSETEKETIIQKYGSMNLALEARKDLNIMMKAVFPIGNEVETSTESSEDKFPRTQLILSAWQLVEENYPLPLKGKLKKAYADYVMTKDEYKPVTANSPLFGIDCEMCITNAGSELTRVSVVDEQHKVVYESHVKPYNNITDYLTKFSGITEASLQNITKRLEDVQNDLRNILPADAILVGQSLNIDLHALKMMHPYIIDTSMVFNFTGERSRKPKLKTLAKEFLNEDIQSSKKGHCPIEDALTALKLVQLKLSKNIEFGDAVHTNRQKYKENYAKMVTKKDYAISIFNHMLEQKKTSLIVGCDNITGDYHTYLSQAKESVTNQFKKAKPKKLKLNTVDDPEEVITNLTTAVKEYNFTMAHLRLELDATNTLEMVATVDKWIKRVWDSVPHSALCVVIFGGTATDNGLAMIRVKNV